LEVPVQDDHRQTVLRPGVEGLLVAVAMNVRRSDALAPAC